MLKEDEVLIKVEDAALNRADLMQREGDYPPPEGCPEWMGLEVSGEIVEMTEGAHTIARPEFESHPEHFTHRDDIKVVLNLISAGRLNLNGMIKEVHKPDECTEIYSRLVNDKNFPILVQFDWR